MVRCGACGHAPVCGDAIVVPGRPVADLKKTCATYDDRFRTGCGTGETLLDFKRRVGEALYDIERTYADETILIVGHEYTAWLLQCVARGANTKLSI